MLLVRSMYARYVLNKSMLNSSMSMKSMIKLVCFMYLGRTNKRVFQIIVIHIVNLLSVLRPNMENQVEKMKVSDHESNRILGISKFFLHILIH